MKFLKLQTLPFGLMFFYCSNFWFWFVSTALIFGLFFFVLLLILSTAALQIVCDSSSIFVEKEWWAQIEQNREEKGTPSSWSGSSSVSLRWRRRWRWSSFRPSPYLLFSEISSSSKPSLFHQAAENASIAPTFEGSPLVDSLLLQQTAPTSIHQVKP